MRRRSAHAEPPEAGQMLSHFANPEPDLLGVGFFLSLFFDRRFYVLLLLLFISASRGRNKRGANMLLEVLLWLYSVLIIVLGLEGARWDTQTAKRKV